MTCKPQIKSYHSPDVADLATWIPDRLEDIYILLELGIGPSDSDANDLFQVVVCTPEALREQEDHDTVVIEDRGLLVVSNYVWRDIIKHLGKIVASCEGESWETVSSNLQRYFHWEYEDYVEEAVTH